MLQKIQIKIRKIKINDKNWIKEVFNKRWGGDFIVTIGKIHRSEELEGFIAEVDNRKVGLITFKIIKRQMEIVSLDSFLGGKGVATVLLNRALNFAKRKKIKRIWLITTNDNLSALGFWQKKGFNLARLYSNALEISRKLKPGIPIIGGNGIPLKDEIELVMKI